MHVWLCDNARPVWQAPCVIALGRELHNNAVQGNACGLEPSPKRCSLLPAASSHTRGAEEPRRHIFPHARRWKSLRNPNEFLAPPRRCWQPRGRDQLVCGAFMEHTACLDKPTAKTDDHVFSVCYETHTDKNKKTAWLTLNACLPNHCAVSWWSSLCGCMWARFCTTLTFFIQTISLPLTRHHTPSFSARSLGTSPAWLVEIPLSIDEKQVVGHFGDVIEAAFPQAQNRPVGCLQA